MTETSITSIPSTYNQATNPAKSQKFGLVFFEFFEGAFRDRAMSGLRLKVVPDDGPRFLMPVPRATELVADLIKHLHLRTSQGVQKLVPG